MGDSNDDGDNYDTQEAEADVDDTTAYEDEDEREREKREQERKYQVRKMFWCTRDDDDPFWDDEDIGAEFFQLDTEYDVLQEIKQHKNALRDNDDEDNVEVGESEGSGNADADDNVATDDEQEKSDDTYQYPERTREQVINDRYILKQQKTRQQEKLRMERGIQIQKEVDEDIVSSNTSEYNHNDKDDNNKIRNRIESRTHGILLVQMEGDNVFFAYNKEKFDNNDKIMKKEYKAIFRAEEDERFVKGWFCFIFSEPTKSYPKKRKASEKVQQKLYRRLQKEFKRKVRITKKYLDNVGKADMVNLTESKKEKETRKLKRIEIQKQKQKDLRFNQ